MNTKFTNIILVLLAVIPFVIGAFLYPQLPEQIASHWNAIGEVDGYMGKFWGVFLLPLAMVGLFCLYWIIPYIDPLQTNIESFRSYYNGLWVFLFVFMLYIYGLQMAWNMGVRFNFSLAMIPAIAILWYVIGLVMENAKRNWFVGIRTPWTLSSDIVWEKTHKFSGKLYKFLAIVSLLGLFLQGNALFIVLIVPVLLVTCVVVVYSYVQHRRLKGK